VNTTRVRAEIDLDALAENLAVIRHRAGTSTRVLLVVKADAYGHGAVAVAHHAVRLGVAGLGVGTSAEALELRGSGVRVPILVLGTIVDEEAEATLRHGVEVGVHSSDRLRRLAELAGRLGRRARVHLNVDTGMGRLGVPPALAPELLATIHRTPELELAGVMTHLSAGRGALAPETAEQVARFERVLAEARELGLPRGHVHIANSAALFTDLRPLHDTVRPGISAYGTLPEDLPGAEELVPAMRLCSQVVFLKDLPAGAAVGYDSTWRAPRPSRIATLPLGYDDGVPWRLGNRGHVLVRGRRAPIVGRVSMDYTTVDVSRVPGVEVGDEVVLFGAQGGERISVAEVARQAGTIPYEVTCSVGKRVPRVYVGGEDIVLHPATSSRPRHRTEEERAPGALRGES
jgi:alanine racemase